MEQSYDVVVVGGGAAGLSAALTLGRARRSVVVVDAAQPRNAPAAGVHGYLGCEGVPPAELLARGREEAARYGAVTTTGRVVAVDRPDPGPGPAPGPGPGPGGFVVHLQDGRRLRGRRLLLTTGLLDELPDVDGVADRWGRDVLHCPYCHGWETRDRPVGVLASGPSAAGEAMLLRQWSADVVLLTHDQGPPDAGTLERLEAVGVGVVGGRAVALVVEDDRLCGVRLATGEVVLRESLVVTPRLRPRDDLLEALGLTPSVQHDGPAESGRFVPSASGATEVPGLYVAGNLVDPAAVVVTAASSGLLAATAVNVDLVQADADAAVARLRARRGGTVGPAAAQR